LSEYFDTHAHLNFASFSTNLKEVLDRARSENVTRIVLPAINLETSHEVIRLAEENPEIFCAVGIHPNESFELNTNFSKSLMELAGQPKVVAIGEIGLDFYHTDVPPKKQEIALITQLEIASDLGLPVILHSRNAFKELWNLIIEWKDGLVKNNHPQADHPGVFHAFEGNYEGAHNAIENGFFIGVGGQITYKNNADKREVISKLPLTSLIIETDSPFLSPHPRRGKRNEPSMIPLIAQQLAEIFHKPVSQIADQTTENALNLFLRRKTH
jgi:TatD DNase family protein